MKTKITPLKRILSDPVWNSIYDSVNDSVSSSVWRIIGSSTLDSYFYPIRHSVWSSLYKYKYLRLPKNPQEIKEIKEIINPQEIKK